MTRGRLLISLAVLALAIALVQFVAGWLRPPAKVNEQVGPQRSGYVLKDFTLHSYADDGSLSFRIQAPSLTRRESDQSLFINQPRFLLPAGTSSAAPPWHGQSEYAWVRSDNQLVRLMGKVDMHRPASPVSLAGEIHTSDASVWPRQHKLATSQPARMRQGTSRMSGIGLRANLATHHMELLHDFHGTFEPSTHD